MILSTRSLLVDVLLSESEEDHKRYSGRVDVYERGLAKIVDRATGEEGICERRELVREERKQTRKMLDRERENEKKCKRRRTTPRKRTCP